GLGGVGGIHLMNLARIGVGRFHIADFDQFEIANFNRQMGASTSTLGQKKVGVMKSLALDLNPHLEIKTFDAGLNDSNLEAFFEGVDLYVDGLDFFCIEIRRKAFAMAR